jgi:HAD superfamily hydrolase (TIGR01509 family)
VTSADIFDLVVKENNLDLNETVFIDDSPQHIEGAEKYGLTAWHLRDGEKVEEVFSKVINI